MGILRKIAKILFGFLFSLSLIFLILTFFLRNLTSYENAKSIFHTIYSNIILNVSGEKIESAYENITLYCKLYPNFTFSVDNLTVNCSEILGKDLSSTISTIAYKIFDHIYFKNYECSFIDCLKNIKSSEDFLIILSNKAYEFFDEIFKVLIVVTIALAMLLLISIETWSGRIKSFGLEFLSIGIFFFIFPWLQNFIFQKLPVAIEKNALDLIFGQLYSIFLFLFILGTSLILIWALIKIFSKKSK